MQQQGFHYGFVLKRDGREVRNGNLYREAQIKVGDELFGYDDEVWVVEQVENGFLSKNDGIAVCSPRHPDYRGGAVYADG